MTARCTGWGMMSKPDDLRFQAIVARVQTLADNGLRVTLDLPEQAVVEAAQLMELKRLGAVLDVTVKGQ